MQHMVRRLVCLATVAGFGFGARAEVPPEAYAPERYAQDGLVLHWDARANSTNELGEVCYDESATVWRNLKGDDFNWVLNDKAEWKDYGLVLPGSAYVARMPNKTKADFYGKLQTVEIVYRNDEKRAGIIFNPGFNMAAYVYTDTAGHVGFYGGLGNTFGIAATVGDINTYSVQYAYSTGIPSAVDKGFVNGSAASNDGMNDYWSMSGGMDDPILGGRSNNQTYAKGVIYAIRIYTRVLTDEERRQHYIYDRARFCNDVSQLRYVKAFDVAPQPKLPAMTEVCPDVVVSNKLTGALLTRGTDFNLTYSDNTSAGTGTVHVVGLNAYSGQDLDLPFEIYEVSGDDYRLNEETGLVEVRVRATANIGRVEPSDSWVPCGRWMTLTFVSDEEDVVLKWSGAPEGWSEIAPDERSMSLVPSEPLTITVTVTREQDLTPYYVRDGLVGFFDGLMNAANAAGVGQHDPDAKTWTDRVTKKAFPLDTLTSGDHWADDALVFGSGSSRFTFINSGSFPPRSMIQLYETGNTGSWLDSSDDNFWWSYNNNLKIFWRVNGERMAPPSGFWSSAGTVNIGSETNWYGMSRGLGGWTTKPNELGTKTYGASVCVGGNGDPTTAGAKIHFIRVYDRILTDDERAWNDALDGFRYRGVPVETAFANYGENYSTNPATGFLTVRVRGRVLSGAGVLRINGMASDCSAVNIGNKVRMSFEPTEGITFKEWVGLPEDAVQIDNATVEFRAVRPMEVGVRCETAYVSDCSVRVLSSTSAEVTYEVSQKVQKVFVRYGADRDHPDHEVVVEDAPVSGRVVISGFTSGIQCYVTVVSFDGQYESAADPISFAAPLALFVSPSGRPGNVGTSWSEALPFTNAMLVASRATVGGEIWVAGTNAVSVAAGTYALSVPVVIRGGFAGTEADPSGRPDGAFAVLDGLDANDVLTVNNGAALTLERLVIRRGNQHGVKKAGSGDLTLDRCQFLSNGVYTVASAAIIEGKALQVDNAVGARIAIRDTVFRGNRLEPVTTGSVGSSAYFANCAGVTLDRCVFAGNGVRLITTCWDLGPSRGGFDGAAILASVPLTARGCRFVGNVVGSDKNYGGIIRLNGGAGGSAFTNCVFAANENICSWGTSSSYAGNVCNYCSTLLVCSGGKRVDVANCTFAGNVACGYYLAAGINVVAGSVHVINSVFNGNLISPRARMRGSDIHVKGGATCAVEYTLFNGPELDDAVGVMSGGTFEPGEGIVFGDARFVTQNESVTNLVKTLDYGGEKYYYFDPSEGTAAVLESVNVHLRGGKYVDEATGTAVFARGTRSPALNTGDPKSDYSQEPKPNGRRVNLGAYGNTPWATMSPAGTALIVR